MRWLQPSGFDLQMAAGRYSSVLCVCVCVCVRACVLPPRLLLLPGTSRVLRNTILSSPQSTVCVCVRMRERARESC